MVSSGSAGGQAGPLALRDGYPYPAAADKKAHRPSKRLSSSSAGLYFPVCLARCNQQGSDSDPAQGDYDPDGRQYQPCYPYVVHGGALRENLPEAQRGPVLTEVLYKIGQTKPETALPRVIVLLDCRVMLLDSVEEFLAVRVWQGAFAYCAVADYLAVHHNQSSRTQFFSCVLHLRSELG